MPNQGIAILYNILNQAEGISCERGYVPWPDMGDAMREAGIPLLSLEGAAPVASFDIVGLHVPHEMAVTNFLEALDLAGIPLLAADRGEDDPIIIAGGPRCTTPSRTRPSSMPSSSARARNRCSRPASCIGACATKESRARRLLSSLHPLPATTCRRSMRFVTTSPARRMATPCRARARMLRRGLQARRRGFRRHESAVAVVRALCAAGSRSPVYRDSARLRPRLSFARRHDVSPVRERSADQIVSSVIQGLEKTGYDEVSLTSLSTTDHSCIRDVLGRLNRRLEDTGIRVSIPSQRLDSFGVDMAESVAGEKKGGLTFAPGPAASACATSLTRT